MFSSAFRLSPLRIETTAQENRIGCQRDPRKKKGPGETDRSLRLIQPVAVWLAAVLLAGCGVPGEPLPPLLEIPERASDLSITQTGARLRLVWSPPSLTTEGTRVRRLARLEIYGVFLTEGATLTNFPESSRLLATLQADEISALQEQIAYELPVASGQLRQTAFFAVKAVNDIGRDAGFSNLAQLKIVDLPDAPLDLQATLTEDAIHLAWKAPPASAFGGPAPQPDGYRIYRAEAGSQQTAALLGTARSPAYQDSTFAYGQRYVYSVRAFVGEGDSAVTTPPSNPAEVDAADRFPPASPLNVRGVTIPGAVDLIWSPNPEPDLAGYNVYRQQEQDGARLRLNRELLPTPLFHDPSVTPGNLYTYQVTAADGNGNESVPSEAVQLTAE